MAKLSFDTSQHTTNNLCTLVEYLSVCRRIASLPNCLLRVTVLVALLKRLFSLNASFALSNSIGSFEVLRISWMSSVLNVVPQEESSNNKGTMHNERNSKRCLHLIYQHVNLPSSSKPTHEVSVCTPSIKLFEACNF